MIFDMIAYRKSNETKEKEMFKAIISAATGIMFIITGMTVSAQENFKPQVQKVTVNGQVLYELGSGAKSLEIDSAKDVKVEYTFANNGSSPASQELRIFVHFENGGDILVNGDYQPSIPTTQWIKGKKIVDSGSYSFAKQKGKTFDVFVGLFKEDRYDMDNEGVADDKRLKLGSLICK